MSGRTPISINTKKAHIYDAIRIKRDNASEDYKRTMTRGGYPHGEWNQEEFDGRVHAFNHRDNTVAGWFQRECERSGIC